MDSPSPPITSSRGKLFLRACLAHAAIARAVRAPFGLLFPKTPTPPTPAALTAASSSSEPVPPGFRRKRVAVIGGGIAGCSAAWSLARAGFTVEVFETRHTLGGNAKTIDWELPVPAADKAASDADGMSSLVRTGLSVLAWPRAYFRNYILLLKTLGIPWQPVELPFLIHSETAHTHTPSSSSKTANELGSFFAQDDTTSPLTVRFAEDLKLWDEVCALVRTCSRAYTSPQEPKPSLYSSSVFNPFNYLPLHLLLRWYGVSDAFWTEIIVPVYSSSFLSARLRSLPSVIAPIIDDIIPLTRSPQLDSWDHNSSLVFDRLAESFDRVHLSTRIVSVSPTAAASAARDSEGSAPRPCLVPSAAPYRHTVTYSPLPPAPSAGDERAARDAAAACVIAAASASTAGALADTDAAETAAVTAGCGTALCGGSLEKAAALRHCHNISGISPATDAARDSAAFSDVITGANASSSPAGGGVSAAGVTVSSQFDAVVFACPSSAAAQMLGRASPLQRALLSSFSWTDQGGERTFLEGIIHSDVSVIPEQYREDVLAKYSNYIETTRVADNVARAPAAAAAAAAAGRVPVPLASDTPAPAHAPRSAGAGASAGGVEAVAVLLVALLATAAAEVSGILVGAAAWLLALGSALLPSSAPAPASGSTPTPAPAALPPMQAAAAAFASARVAIADGLVAPFHWVGCACLISLPSAIFLAPAKAALEAVRFKPSAQAAAAAPAAAAAGTEAGDAEYACENTFVLSSWIPEVQNAYARADAVAAAAGRGPVPRRPMLVTYNIQPHKRALIDPALQHAVGYVTNVAAHPELTAANLARGQLVRLLQGRGGLYYASSWCTPGTGHDLSLLSGLAVAHAMGAPYPFAEDAVVSADYAAGRRPGARLGSSTEAGTAGKGNDDVTVVRVDEARKDFDLLRGIVGL